MGEPFKQDRMGKPVTKQKRKQMREKATRKEKSANTAGSRGKTGQIRNAAKTDCVAFFMDTAN